MPEYTPHTKDLSTEQAAALMAVHARSVLRWVKAGRLPAYQTGGGRWRIRPTALASFMVAQGMSAPAFLTASAARIVVVDDDEPLVAALVATLAELAPHADVRAAHDGLSAGLLLASFRPHLLLLDLVMPGLDGFEVLRQLRTFPDLDGTSVVVLSGMLSPDARRRLLDLGAVRCLDKPPRQADLMKALVDFLPGVAQSVVRAQSHEPAPGPRQSGPR